MEQMKDGLKYCGTMHLVLKGSDGLVREERHVKNTITNKGLDWLIRTTMNSELTGGGQFYIGSTASAGTADAGDDTGTTSEGGRQPFTYATGGTIGTMSGTATFGASGVGAPTTTGITEAGIYVGGESSSGDGVLFCRSIFTAVNKGASDTLQIKWDIAFS